MIDSAGARGPAPMEGHGAYNRSSHVQAAGSSPALPLLEEAARRVAMPNAPEPLVIADYGASEGHNSLAPMAAAIGILRERIGAVRPISVVHTDLPGNDFGALFRTLETDPESYQRRDAACFSFAVGRSFYRQIMPAGSVTLGWTSWSVQWLSRTPGPIPDHVQIAFSADRAARDAYARQAAEDWHAFLVARGNELRPGGRIVVLSPATDDQGQGGFRRVTGAIHEALRALADEGFLGAAEVGRMVLPIVGRTRNQFLDPFARTGRFADLAIEHVDLFQGADPIWDDYRADGDREKFGARWAAFTRAAVFPTLALELAEGSEDPRVPAFFTKLEADIAARLSAAPEPVPSPLASLVLVKEDRAAG